MSHSVQMKAETKHVRRVIVIIGGGNGENYKIYNIFGNQPTLKFKKRASTIYVGNKPNKMILKTNNFEK